MLTRLFGYRLQLFDLDERITVAEACRTFGVHRLLPLEAAGGCATGPRFCGRASGVG
jgi:hypothetical protein